MLVSVLLLDTIGWVRPHAAENWMLATPEPLPEPINLPNSMQVSPSLSADGLSLYFSSDRPGGLGGLDLWVLERASVNDPWGTPTNLGTPINTPRAELGPSLSADGLTLYFMDGNPFGVNPRAGGPGNYQIWTSTRANRQSPWQTPVDLKAPVGSPATEGYPFLTADGLALYFTSSRSSPAGLFVSERETADAPWRTPVNLGPRINQGGWTGFPCLSSSGLHLLFYSDRPGGQGANDLWMSTRPSVADGWAAAANLGSAVNSAYHDAAPTVSSDFPALGSYLLFTRNDASEWNTRIKIYRSEVIPSMTLFRAPNLSDGPWLPVAASFTKTSDYSYEVEVRAVPTLHRSFYRMILNGRDDGLRIGAAAQSDNRLRIQVEWLPESGETPFIAPRPR